MVEEYSTETNVVLRRAWKEKNKFGKDIGWVVEVGVIAYKPNNIELYGIQENSSMVCYFFYIYDKPYNIV